MSKTFVFPLFSLLFSCYLLLMHLVVQFEPHDFPHALTILHAIKDLLPATAIRGPSLASIIQRLNETNVNEIATELSALMAAGPAVSCEPAKVVQAIVEAHMQALPGNIEEEDTNEIYCILLSR